MEAVMQELDTVRAEVLRQHEVLRNVFGRIKDGLFAVDAVQILTEGLRASFLKHLSYEETFLVPVLLRLDAWGPQHVTRMLKEHASQRDEIEKLQEQTDRMIILEFVRTLELDMDGEEKWLRSLNDDIGAEAQFTG